MTTPAPCYTGCMATQTVDASPVPTSSALAPFLVFVGVLFALGGVIMAFKTYDEVNYAQRVLHPSTAYAVALPWAAFGGISCLLMLALAAGLNYLHRIHAALTSR